MKEYRNNNYKDTILKKLGSAQDKFSINIASSKINIINTNCKTSILSYYIEKDTCGLAVSVYGVIFTEITYIIEKDHRKCVVLFTTPFNQIIYLPNNKCKVRSVSVSLKNKYLNESRDCNILAYFTLLFTVKVYVPVCNECPTTCKMEMKELECVNTINIDSDFLEEDDDDYCDDIVNCDDTPCMQLKSNNVIAGNPINYNQNPSGLKNDMLKYLTSFQQNNRL